VPETTVSAGLSTPRFIASSLVTPGTLSSSSSIDEDGFVFLPVIVEVTAGIGDGKIEG